MTMPSAGTPVPGACAALECAAVRAPKPTAAATHTASSTTPVSPALGRLRIRELLHRAICLIDRLVGISGGGSIGVRDGDPAERLAADFARRLPFGPVGIPERVVLIRVAVRPAVDGD